MKLASLMTEGLFSVIFIVNVCINFTKESALVVEKVED